jgi:hypothetical protein
MGHALLRPKSIRSKFSNFGGIEQLGPQGMFQEEAALQQVEALERGTLAPGGGGGGDPSKHNHGAHNSHAIPRSRTMSHHAASNACSSSTDAHHHQQSSDHSHHRLYATTAHAPAQTA